MKLKFFPLVACQPNSSAFAETSHSNADIAWWKDAWNQDYVLSRDQVAY